MVFLTLGHFTICSFCNAKIIFYRCKFGHFHLVMERRRRGPCPPLAASPCAQRLPPLITSWSTISKRLKEKLEGTCPLVCTFPSSRYTYNVMPKNQGLFRGISLREPHLKNLIGGKDVQTVLNQSCAVGPVGHHVKKLYWQNGLHLVVVTILLPSGGELGSNPKTPPPTWWTLKWSLYTRILGSLPFHIYRFGNSPSHKKFSQGPGWAQLTGRK